jgi:hypothetical protein
VGSHFGAIGLPAERDRLPEAFRRMLTTSSLVGTSPMGDVRVYAYEDGSGSRATMTIVGEALTCFTPSFRPGTRLTFRAGSLGASDCAYERPLLGDLIADGEKAYPLAIAIEDVAVTERAIPLGEMVTVEVAALAEQLSVFPDEAAYRAGGTPMAVRSVIPSGLFAIGQEPSEPIMPTPRIFMSGEVTSSRMLRHGAFDVPFGHATVTSYGAEYTLLIDVNDLTPLGFQDGLPVGSIVSSTCWLSGRLVDGPPGGSVGQSVVGETTTDAH